MRCRIGLARPFVLDALFKSLLALRIHSIHFSCSSTYPADQSADGVYPPDDEAMQQISHPGSD